MYKKLLIISVLFSVLSISSCNTSESTNLETNQNEGVDIVQHDESIINQISKDVKSDEFKTLIAEGNYHLVDVRTPEEYAAGTIEDAVNINFYDADFKEKITTLSNDKPVLVFCAAGAKGGRSGQAKEIFSNNDFNSVYNLIGGYSGWSSK